MKKSTTAILAIAFGLSGLGAGGAAKGDDVSPLRIDLNKAGTIKIDMSAMTMIPPEPPPTALEQALSAIGDLRHDVEEFHKARSAYKRALENCATRSYTVAEMRAAGCENNDTVAACSRKLLYSCIMSARRPAEKLREAALQADGKVHAKLPAALSLPAPPQP